MAHLRIGRRPGRFTVGLCSVACLLFLATAVPANACCPFDCADCVCFWRLTVASLFPPSWTSCLPLGCAPMCADSGWPQLGLFSGDSYLDAGIRADPSPLVLYEVSDIGNRLRLVKSGTADIAVSF